MGEDEIVVEPSVPLGRFSWTIEAPESLPLSFKSQLMQVHSKPQGTTQGWDFSHGPSEVIALEPGTANADAWVPRVMASTLPDLASLSDRFAQRLRAKMRVSLSCARWRKNSPKGSPTHGSRPVPSAIGCATTTAASPSI